MLHFERHNQHPPERVWRALTESEYLPKWMARLQNVLDEVPVPVSDEADTMARELEPLYPEVLATLG